MLRYLIIEPIRKKRLSLFLLRICQILHVGTNGRFDTMAKTVMKRFLPRVEFPPSKLFPDDDPIAIANAVREDGYFVCNRRLPTEMVEAIKRFAFATAVYADDPTIQIAITQDHIPTNYYRLNWRLHDVTANVTIRDILFDSYFHRIAQEYLQCRPVLTSVLLWLNPVCPGTHTANIFHYDNDGPAFVKFFVYLSDVTESTGPHVFIRRTHTHMKPEKFRHSRRYEEQELLEFFGHENKKVFTGPAGTMIVEDTMGFHRGSEVFDSYRLVLQLEYGLVDVPHIEEFTIGVRKHQANGLHKSIKKVLRKFYD